ncbi:MAG: hypothetical protein ACI84C_000742 [Flavobacteriales bacterium]|jgi:hypothetical protein
MIKTSRRLRAAAFLLLAFAVGTTGCKKPEQNIGLGLQPEEDILNAIQTDTVSIEAYTLIEDSLRMDDFSRSMLGNQMDAIFGKSSASIFTQFRLTSSNVDFGDLDLLEVDSIILSIAYGEDIYGPRNSQYFSIHEIEEQLFIDSVYYSNQKVAFNPVNLVQNTFDPSVIDPNATTIIDGESVEGLLRIPLVTSLGDQLIAASGTDSLSNNVIFSEFFAGLHIQSLTTDAAILQLDLTNALSNMTMYYRRTGAEADTLQYIFDLNSSCARFTSWEHDYTQELSALQAVDTLRANPHTYVRAGACVKTGIKFPFIDDFRTDTTIIVNKAELIVPATLLEGDRFPNQSFLFTRTLDADGETVEMPDASTFSFNQGGAYDEVNQEYRFIITRYLQEIIKGERPDRGMTLISNNGAVSARRVVLNGPSTSTDDSSKNMRLILTYSE